MVTRVQELTTSRPVIEQDFTSAQELRDWTKTITDQATIIGTGSPEGVIEAFITAMYMGDTGAAGSIMYVKKLADIGGDKSQGWILI